MLYGRVSLQLIQSTSDTLEAFSILTDEHNPHQFTYEQIIYWTKSIS